MFSTPYCLTSSRYCLIICSEPAHDILKSSDVYNDVSPVFILFAFSMITLPLACLCVVVSLATGITPLSIMSLKTAPAPTLCSWSTSPIMMTVASGLMWLNNICASFRSIIDASSTRMMSSSMSRAFSASSSSYIRSFACIVLASLPVACSSLLAAFPVGAIWQTVYSGCACVSASITVSLMVLFPVPGPPVMMER